VVGVWVWVWCGLDREVPSFFRPDADGLLNFGNENFAVADLAGARGSHDGFHHAVGDLVGNDDVEFDFGQEIDGVFAATINFRVALLAAKAFDLADGHPLDANLAEGVFDFLEFERLDDGFDFLHA
jgi:hypothetical protein